MYRQFHYITSISIIFKIDQRNKFKNASNINLLKNYNVKLNNIIFLRYKLCNFMTPLFEK